MYAIYSPNYRETRFLQRQNRLLLLLRERKRNLLINIDPLCKQLLNINRSLLSKILFKSFHFKSYLTVKLWKLFEKILIIVQPSIRINLKGINRLTGQKEHLCSESSQFVGRRMRRWWHSHRNCKIHPFSHGMI